MLTVALAIAMNFAWDAGVPAMNADSPLYLILGHNLRAGRGFVAPDRISISLPEPGWERNRVVPCAIRSPGYPLLLSVVSVRGILAMQKWINVGLALFVFAAAFRVTRQILSATLAGVIFATWLPSVSIANEVMTDTVFAVIVALLFWLCWRRSSALGMMAISAAIVVGVAPLVRPIAMFLPVVLAIYFLAARRATIALLMLVVGTIPTALWITRNLRATGAAVLESSTPENVLFFRAASVLAVRDRPLSYGLFAMQQQNDFYHRMVHLRPALLEIALEEMRSHGLDPSHASQAQRSVWYGRVGTSIIAQQPLQFAKVMFSGLLRLHVEPLYEAAVFAGWDYRSARVLLDPLGVAILLAAIVGWRDLRRIDRSFANLIALFILYFTVLSAGPDTEARFTSAYAPMLAIAAGHGVHVVSRWRRTS